MWHFDTTVNMTTVISVLGAMTVVSRFLISVVKRLDSIPELAAEMRRLRMDVDALMRGRVTSDV